MARQLLLSSLLLVGLTACATTEGYRQNMSLWQGRSLDDVMINWGEPDSRSFLSDGRELVIFDKIEIYEHGGYTSYEYRDVSHEYVDDEGKKRWKTVSESYPIWIPPYTTTSRCATRFVVTEDGYVEQITFEGDGCVAEEIY
ncbi:MAG: hypothetical protein AAGB25_00050 [Pseudomonadota bacterium]